MHPEQAASHADAQPMRRRALHMIAAFEALKGGVALAAMLGFLSLLHRDLHHLALTLIGHLGLDPGARVPALLLHNVDRLHDTNPLGVLLLAAAYVAVRFAEAYGLWRQRVWGEWLGALSGALYVPFELRHLVLKPGALGLAVVVANVAVVAFLAWQLWCRHEAARRARATPGTTTASDPA